MPDTTDLPAEFRPDADHITITPSVLYVGTPVALITTLNPDGTTTISPMSSAWMLFDRVVLGMTSTSKGPNVEAIARGAGRASRHRHRRHQPHRRRQMGPAALYLPSLLRNGTRSRADVQG
ncbi:hypothetical protein [Acidisphaera rubrifaciens]|uniref:Flavin reductase like domain-containing protein n=1 Tax=Acidisphaera rubrifaciens HS-AP3 TaxID=1231350 RepID=A0A0D6P6W2_9PROT|nr:hypothetical protein [Acidisphaera rubrifaciens]GAN77081.1 hypothetical protein Asru_0231_03 [Acidisphaera rubrifaciens HS-AP3]